MGDEKKDVKSYFIDALIKITLEEEKALPVVKQCIDECPECAKYCDGNTSLLHKAARYGTPEMIAYIANAGGDVNCTVGEYEITPMFDAIVAKKIDNVRKLIELGAEIDSDVSATSPVLASIGDHYTDILQLLIDAGADITYQYKTKDNPWWDALTFAKYNLQDEAVEILERELRKRGINPSEDEEIFKRNQKKLKKPKLKKRKPKKQKLKKRKKQKNLPAHEEVDYAGYIEDQLGEIVQYYDAGDILEVLWAGEPVIENEEVSISVYGILPEDKDYGILITCGMSEFPMAETEEGLEYAEVMMKVPKEWMEDGELLENPDYNWTLEILCKTAYLGHMYEDMYVNEKVVVPYGEPDEVIYFDSDYEFTGVMLCKAEDIPALEADEDTLVKFYTLIPITEEEAKLVKEKGSEAVKKMLRSGEKTDLERKPLVEPEE